MINISKLIIIINNTNQFIFIQIIINIYKF